MLFFVFSGSWNFELDIRKVCYCYDFVLCTVNRQFTCSKLPQETAQAEINIQGALREF
jgi:hypothetical protein